MVDWIGYRWLAEQYHIESVQRFRVESEIGTVPMRTLTVSFAPFRTTMGSFRTS